MLGGGGGAQGTRGGADAEVAYRPRTNPSDGWAREFGHNKVFTPAEEEQQEQSATMRAKQQHLTSAVVFCDDAGRPGKRSTRVAQAPGGTSSIVFG